jgi:methylenetetrahydrofolate reductase (NADPH)
VLKLTNKEDIGLAALIGALTHPRFELVPIRGVEEQASYLPPGAKVTVTCSPTRGIENTLAVAEQLSKQDFQVVPHISARLVVDRAHLKDILQRVADVNLREIFVIGGDAREPVGKFAGALDLLRAMAELGHNVGEIGVAAYPEHHPLIDDETLRQALWEKQRFATYMVTQICFDARVITRWLGEIRQGGHSGGHPEGTRLPVYIGLPGAVDAKHLLRISMKIGVGDSVRFLSRHTSLAAGLFRRAGYHLDELVDKLAPAFGDSECKIQGLHLNTFNQVENTERWRQQKLATLHERM